MIGRKALFALTLTGLWLTVAASAVSVVHARHEARKLFIELEQLNARRDELIVEWNKLRLEQSAWATHARVEALARNDLAMHTPEAREIVLVTP